MHEILKMPRKKSFRILSQQPSVIPIFFATEMWERFGFYMIQGILILYMTSQIFQFSDMKSYGILGAFAAISYITPIIGGYIAARILDFEHAITLGGFLLAGGYAILAMPHEHFFYIALAIISIGNGFFKPNISSYLGDFYKPDDPYREKGYTIFYVGINIGVLLSTGSSGYIVRYFGWHIPFLVASIGLIIGTVTFVFGLYYLKNTNNFHRLKPSIAHKNTTTICFVYLATILLTYLSYEIIRHRAFSNILMLGGGSAVFLGLFIYAFRYPLAQRNKFLAAIFLTLFSILFWAIFFQMFFSMNLFIERLVNRQFFHFTLPTPLFLSLESIYIVIFGLFFAAFWQRLAKKKKNPYFPLKFSIAMLLLCVAFLIAYIGTKYPMINGQINKIFIIITYWFITIGELLLSPVGLAMITVLVPQELVGLMMGVWFVALGLGEKLAGIFANFADIPSTLTLNSSIIPIYGQAFLKYAFISLGCGIICLLTVPLINKLIGKDK